MASIPHASDDLAPLNVEASIALLEAWAERLQRAADAGVDLEASAVADEVTRFYNRTFSLDRVTLHPRQRERLDVAAHNLLAEARRIFIRLAPADRAAFGPVLK